MMVMVRVDGADLADDDIGEQPEGPLETLLAPLPSTALWYILNRHPKRTCRHPVRSTWNKCITSVHTIANAAYICTICSTTSTKCQERLDLTAGTRSSVHVSKRFD